MLLTLTALALSATPPPPDVPARMRSLFAAVTSLEASVAQPQRLLDPAHKAQVLADLNTLASLGHVFKADTKSQEPATQALAGLFARYAADTSRRFERGDTAAVPFRVRTLVSLCFTCHSRERVSRDFVDPTRQVDALGLPRFERAQYLAATRQFDAALTAYDEVLGAPLADERAVVQLAHALRDVLAMGVRVKDDPAFTQRVLAQVAARQDLPEFLRAPLRRWQRDTQAWAKEKFDARAATPDVLFAKAKRLVLAASGPAQLLPDDTSEVAYLRASGYLNLALQKDPAFKQRGEALFLLGVAMAALKTPTLWELDQLFFEACIRENPATPLAARCFHQLSERLYFGFTGSAGTNLPDEELERLEALRRLAQPPR